MRMELIQPFINAADAVFSDLLHSSAKIIDLTMDEDTYRRKGVAALIAIKGDIEGRVILDLSPEGFRFKVFPPEIHADETGLSSTVDTEAMVLGLETPCGEIYLNIAMHYLRRRRSERGSLAVLD
jgi:CheY-specific phosphatase CheX